MQLKETKETTRATYDETFNKIRTFSSLDLLTRFSATAKGEVLGIGGSVTNTTEARAHTELETETFNHKKTEKILNTSAEICFAGPVYRDDVEYGLRT